jgi:putative ABC transport system permease protein
MDLPRALRLTVSDLLKQPGYTGAAVVTLALAIGANSAIFSAVHGVLLQPSPIRQPNELVICWERDASRSPVVELSYRNFQDWVAHSRSFSQAAAIGSSTWPAILDGRGEPVRLASAGVSASFFHTLGVVPSFARGFRPEDDAPNAERVVILSHTTWVTRRRGFGRNRYDDEAR